MKSSLCCYIAIYSAFIISLVQSYSIYRLTRPLSKVSMQFGLNDYVSNNLIINQHDLHKNYVKVSYDTFDNVSNSFYESKSYIFLVDITVRSLVDIDQYKSYPFWEQFTSKLKSSNNDLSKDIFLYEHDIGERRVCKVVLARIPQEKYQMLDLSKRLANICSSSCVVVHLFDQLTNQNKESFKQIRYSLISAYQVNKFNMPSLKQQDQDMKTPYKDVELQFIIETKESGEINDIDDISDSSIDSNVNNPVPLSKAVELEKAMIEASKQRDLGNYLDNFAITNKKQLEADPGYLINGLNDPNLTNQIVNRNLDQIDDKDLYNEVKISYNDLVDDASTALSTASSYMTRIDQLDVNTQKAMTHGTNIARSLASLPPNILYPESYSNSIKLMSEAYNWEYSEWFPDVLLNEGNMGAFYAVCGAKTMSLQGENRSDRLIRLVYTPSKRDQQELNNPSKNQENQNSDRKIDEYWNQESIGGIRALQVDDKPIVLVGKGVCYDTGGINVKTANSMKTMKHDMSGSGVALGVLTALTLMNVTNTVECWLAIVENNMPSSSILNTG